MAVVKKKGNFFKVSTPKRIAIIGLPGSGKSTFATRLGKLLDIPVHHLDTHMFLPDGTKRVKQEFIDIQQKMVDQEAWIIEGCSLSTLEMRFARADAIIYFDFSRWHCIWRMIKRSLFFDDALSKTGCIRRLNWVLLKYIWTFDKVRRQGIEALKNRYPGVEFQVLRNVNEVESYAKRF